MSEWLNELMNELMNEAVSKGFNELVCEWISFFDDIWNEMLKLND